MFLCVSYLSLFHSLNQTLMQIENETHYLGEEFEHVHNNMPVGAGKRFANFFIDRIVITISIYVFNTILQQTDAIIRTETELEARLVNILYSWIIYVVLMFAMEALMKGRSIGKLITRTRAVNQSDGSPINARTALLRSLCRIVPFEPFSAFGNPSFPWHDTWTKSMVVAD